jgi:hypothetical protein
MAVTAEQSAPYAPQTVILGLLDRNREKGLPNPVTTEVLQRLGVSDSLVPRTLQALKILDLVDKDGKHTEVLDALRLAPEADYKARMAEWLMAAYEHALDVIDPATANEVSIRDAFRHYNPISMQPRMITLFTSLFEAAGVRAPAPAGAAKPKVVKAESRSTAGVKMGVTRRSPAPHQNPPPASGALPAAIAGVLASLPDPATGWTQAERDRFVIAFEAVLDFAVPIVAAAPPAPEPNGGDDVAG